MNRNLRPLVATTLIFLLAYFLAVAQHPGMLSTRVLGNFLTDNAFLGIAAVGMTFVILSGGIDLSVGAVIGFTTVLIAVLIMWLNIHPLLAFAIALIVAAGFGTIMAAAIHDLKVPSFIVTLAGMFLARGGASVLSPDSIGIQHAFYSSVSKSYILLPGGGRLTVVGMIMLAVFAVAILLAHRTRFGSNVYALGVEMDAIAAVVIGDTLLTGGYGFIAGTFIGVMLQGLVKTYIVFDGSLCSWWTKIVVGVLLFLFILLQRLVFRAGPSRT